MRRRRSALESAAAASRIATVARVFLLAGVLAPLASADDDLLRTVRARMLRKHPSVEHHVMAFYYPWYGVAPDGTEGAHWGRWDPVKKDAPGSLRWPVGGPYDSTDPEVVDRHMRQFARAGIDVPIVSWWGPGDRTDEAMAVILAAAAKHGRKVTVYFERVRGRSPDAASAAADLVHLVRKYAAHPAWLRVGRRPVLFLYGRVMGQLGELGWVRALEKARAESGVDWFAVADGIRSSYGALFDGIHTYNTMGLYRDRPEEAWPAVARDHVAAAIRFARPFGHVACATIVPGYDDTKIRKPGARLARAGGRLYEAQWEVALETRPDWILITSFNEWHEGSEIEPSAELGDRYLRETARWTEKWRARGEARDASPTAITTARGKADEVLATALTERGTVRIGLLNGLGPVGIRLLRVTEKIDLVSPADLVEGRISPKRHRVLIYASGESSPTRVRSRGDVPRAIASYLAAGGSLIVSGDLPFPFYYDAPAGRTVRAGRAFGLHLLGCNETRSGKPFDDDHGPAGFERPPAPDLDLRFEVTADLPSLSRTLPWPASGDLRWRPACRPRESGPRQTYRGCLRLTDRHGRDWGDGVAVFGSTDPKAGRVVYAWFRLADVAGLDGFLVDLIRLATRTPEKR